MGSSSSTNVRHVKIGSRNIQNGTYKKAGNGRYENKRFEDKDLSCERHGNTITHFNEKTEHFFCLTCFQDYKRGHTRSEINSVHDINVFIESIQFKQRENQTLHKLRNCKHTTEHNLLHISQITNKLEKKRSQFLDEIKLFVTTVIDLLKHLEDDICRETTRKISKALSELKSIKNNKESYLNQLTILMKDIEKKRPSGNEITRLRAMLKCKTFLNNNSTVKYQVYDYEPVLRLNKDITLNDITGRKGDKKTISLGSVTCERKSDKEVEDIISDVSDAVSDDTTYTNRSSTHLTSSTSGDISSPQYTGEIENVETATKRQGVCSSRNETHTGTPVSGHEDTARKHNNSNKGNILVEKDGEYENQISNKRLTPVPEIFDESQKRQQFRRDSVLSRNIPRRSSHSGTSFQKLSSPRKSSQSIISPGNITTPSFVSPRPRNHFESMERRLATIVQQVTLSRDTHISNITDTAQLADGRIILCDQKNERLLLMDRQFDIRDEIKLSGHPHNVAVVHENYNRIAVTIPDENVIKIVEVTEDNFDERIEVIKLQSKPKCRGIEYADGNLFYTTRNDVAVLRKNDRSRTWKFEYAFRDPVSLRTDRRHGVIFVSCLGAKSYGEVVKMHYKDEKIDFVISCKEINHPVCSTLDREGYIYICDIDPPSVHQVSADGKYCRRLLSSSQGKFQHVNFIEYSDMFIATENDSDTFRIYEMT